MAISRPVEYWRDYFYEVSKDHDIVLLCDAIIDKESCGLGLIWASTDFDGIFARLDEYPDSWIVSQARDDLKRQIERI